MKPLSGKIIISTRPKSNTDKISDILISKGAEIINFPMIEIEKSSLSIREKELLHKIDYFNKIIFTSKNGVKYFFEHYKDITKKPVSQKIKFATIGKNTALSLEKEGYKSHFINKGNNSPDFTENLKAFINVNENILLALGNLAKDILKESISNYAQVTRINFYNTIEPKSTDNTILEKILRKEYDLILFTSPSGFINFVNLCPQIKIEDIKIACIGETTANSMKKYSIHPSVIAEKSNAEGIAESIINYFYKHKTK